MTTERVVYIQDQPIKIITHHFVVTEAGEIKKMIEEAKK